MSPQLTVVPDAKQDQESSIEHQICNALVNDGWVVVADFLPAEQLAHLRHTAQTRSDQFVAAGVGRQTAQQVRNDIRGDAVLWLDDDDAAMHAANQRMRELQQTLNRELYLGVSELEWHFARYPVGSFYRRHLDQHREQDTRVVTVVQYLNADWQSADGGQLRLYLDAEQHIDITPHGGTLVVFMSDRFEHEVLPAQRERLSLTGWYRRR